MNRKRADDDYIDRHKALKRLKVVAKGEVDSRESVAYLTNEPNDYILGLDECISSMEDDLGFKNASYLTPAGFTLLGAPGTTGVVVSVPTAGEGFAAKIYFKTPFKEELEILKRLANMETHGYVVPIIGFVTLPRASLMLCLMMKAETTVDKWVCKWDNEKNWSVGTMSQWSGYSRLQMVEWICARIVKAVAFMFERGIVHGDIKPANVLVRQVREEHCSSIVVELCDFSSSWQCDKHMTVSSHGGSAKPQTTTTLWYSAPEQWLLHGINGTICGATACTDVWSVATLLFTIAHGYPCWMPDQYNGLMDALLSSLPVLRAVGVRAQDVEKLPLLKTLEWENWETPQKIVLDSNIIPHLVCNIWDDCICHADARPEHIGQVAEKYTHAIARHPIALVTHKKSA